MSFTFPPVGLTAIPGYLSYLAQEPHASWVSEGSGYLCESNPKFVIAGDPPRPIRDGDFFVTCHSAEDVGPISWQALLADWAPSYYFPYPDDPTPAAYWQVRVHVNGPGGYGGGHSGCSSISFGGDLYSGSCGPFLLEAPSTCEVDGSYVDDTGAAVANSGSVDGSFIGGSYEELAWLLGGPATSLSHLVNHMVNMVNTAATWPSPDAFGNTAGSCLFTWAQLPAVIEAAASVTNGPGPFPPGVPGRISVRLYPFALEEDDPPPPPPPPEDPEDGLPRQCVVGHG